MAATAGVLTDVQRATLAALCDTYVPSIESETPDGVERDFMARSASDMGIPAQIEATAADTMTSEELAGFAGLLDALAAHEVTSLPVEARTELLHGTSTSDPEARFALQGLKALVMLFFYALPDAQGDNPNWEAIGYPGPASAPPSPEEAPKTIAVLDVDGEDAALSADVCVVGSGAGGSVIAARLAEAGKSVLVLEMGGYRNEQDFKQLELVGMQELYYGAGLARSDDGSIAILAGSTLGGGTVVNYMNCIRTPERIRREWAEHGLEGVADPDYERRIDAVADRIGANTEATKQNATHQRLRAGLDARGLEHRPIVRNASLDDDSAYCGYCPAGCQQGCKRSAMKTWLQDASDAGARCLVGCRVERILTEEGRATGVEATVSRADGTGTRLTVHAPTVVAACGSVESPALLLRSGIGGPAVGKNLRLHPAYAVMGVYDEPIEGWSGQIQSLVSDDFQSLEDGHGFLVEATGMFPGLLGATFPWDDGASHKQLMHTLRWQAPFITVARDHGSGEVTIDELGRAVVRWGLDDEVDARLTVRAHVELARLHQAAGASEIFTTHSRTLRWRHGEDFAEFLERIEGASYDAGDVACFTAHQMGACRMGSDPATSVADGRGQLHDTAGVWVGDASAFPTAPGVNPMVSIMALAHRTADMMLEAPAR
jgi:choline dehydrogenase-like flavoprotein